MAHGATSRCSVTSTSPAPLRGRSYRLRAESRSCGRILTKTMEIPGMHEDNSSTIACIPGSP